MLEEVAPFPFFTVPALVPPIGSPYAIVSITSYPIIAVKLISGPSLNIISTVNLYVEFSFWSI